MNHEAIVDLYLPFFRDGQDALPWYTDAHAAILTVAHARSARPEYLAGLLAAFSPRTSVRRSCTWALTYLSTSTFLDDCPRSVQTHVETFVDTGRVTGPKTGPFWLALLGDPDAVVIDTHMLRAASLSISSSVSEFSDCIAAVRTIARYRCPPSSAQAAIWTGYLRSIGRNPRPFPLLEVHHELLSSPRKD